MPLRINNNVSAMNALRNLSITADDTAKAVERLSTGMRINRAGDDPAGLVISENLRAQITGIQQALNNSQDASNLSKTAEAALGEIQKLLNESRALAVHAANTGVNSVDTIQADQTQIRSIAEAINRIANQTSFGNKKLLDGSSGVTAAISSPANVTAIQLSGAFNGQTISSGTVTMTRTTTATKVSFDGAKTYATAATLIGTTGAIVLNGVSINYSSTDTVAAFMQKINTYSGQTGVLASFDTDHIQLDQQNYGANYSVQIQDAGNAIHTATYSSVAGINAVYNVSAVVYNSTGSTAVATVAFSGGRSTTDSGLKLTDTFGNSVLITEAGNAVAAATTIGLAFSGSVQFQVGGSPNQTAQVSFGDVHANRLGTGAVALKSFDSIDLTAAQGATEGMLIIDDAIAQISRLRGSIGSFQSNVLESNIRSLSVAKENLSATESSIRDADMAEQITQFTKLQILQQSGMAVLAQANTAPQSILQLLK
ncbi:MAG: flagellin [bacterium]